MYALSIGAKYVKVCLNVSMFILHNYSASPVLPNELSYLQVSVMAKEGRCGMLNIGKVHLYQCFGLDDVLNFFKLACKSIIYSKCDPKI